MADPHHVIPKQRVEIARSRLAVKEKLGERLTDAERRLLETPLTTLLRDRRNIVRLSRRRHHRAHQGFERLRPEQLPTGLYDFAEEYSLGWALDHELRLISAPTPPTQPPA